MLKLDEDGTILWDEQYVNHYFDNCDLNVETYPTGGYMIWGCEVEIDVFPRKIIRYYGSAMNVMLVR